MSSSVTNLRIMAAQFKWDALIKLVEDSIEDYNNAVLPSEKEDAIERIANFSVLVSLKFGDSKHHTSIEDIKKDGEKIEKTVDLFHHMNNTN